MGKTGFLPEKHDNGFLLIHAKANLACSVGKVEWEQVNRRIERMSEADFVDLKMCFCYK